MVPTLTELVTLHCKTLLLLKIKPTVSSLTQLSSVLPMVKPRSRMPSLLPTSMMLLPTQSQLKEVLYCQEAITSQSMVPTSTTLMMQTIRLSRLALTVMFTIPSPIQVLELLPLKDSLSRMSTSTLSTHGHRKISFTMLMVH